MTTRFRSHYRTRGSHHNGTKDPMLNPQQSSHTEQTASITKETDSSHYIENRRQSLHTEQTAVITTEVRIASGEGRGIRHEQHRVDAQIKTRLLFLRFQIDSSSLFCLLIYSSTCCISFCMYLCWFIACFMACVDTCNSWWRFTHMQKVTGESSANHCLPACSFFLSVSGDQLVLTNSIPKTRISPQWLSEPRRLWTSVP